jgi:hypothetical protein
MWQFTLEGEAKKTRHCPYGSNCNEAVGNPAMHYIWSQGKNQCGDRELRAILGNDEKKCEGVDKLLPRLAPRAMEKQRCDIPSVGFAADPWISLPDHPSHWRPR